MNILNACLILLITSCVAVNSAVLPPTQFGCSLYESKYPIEFTRESLKPFLEDFNKSKALYDVVLIEIKGGKGLFYKRLSLDNGTAYFYELEANGKLKTHRRPYSSRLTQLVEGVSSGHFASVYQGYSSEPSVDILLVRKAGTAQFSYSLDRNCFEHLSETDRAKVLGAYTVAAYLKKL